MQLQKIVLSIFFVLGFSIISCTTCNPVPSHFEIMGIESTLLEATGSNSPSWKVLPTNRIVYWSEFANLIQFQLNYIAISDLQIGGAINANSCPDYGEAGGLIGIDTLVIQTVYNYNEEYVAGSVINDILLANPYIISNRYLDYDVKITDFINETSNGVREEVVGFRSTEEPSSQTIFALDITMRLNNGEVFKHRTEDVDIRN